jgi:hypothetical protein
MTDEAAREIFNQTIETATDADLIARLEIAREFFTNPEFRAKLADFVWSINDRR